MTAARAAMSADKTPRSRPASPMPAGRRTTITASSIRRSITRPPSCSRRSTRWEAVRKPGYDGYAYGRIGTPTTRAFETAWPRSTAPTMRSRSRPAWPRSRSALMANTKAGDHILVSDSAYYPTRKFCNAVLAKYGVETSYYDPTFGAAIGDLIRPNTA